MLMNKWGSIKSYCSIIKAGREHHFIVVFDWDIVCKIV